MNTSGGIAPSFFTVPTAQRFHSQHFTRMETYLRLIVNAQLFVIQRGTEGILNLELTMNIVRNRFVKKIEWPLYWYA